MDAESIVKLSPDSLEQLIRSQKVEAIAKQPLGHRREDRWPFPGTVEVWLPESCYGDHHVLATLHNLSMYGCAMRSRRPIPIDTRVSIAIHQPALSCYGSGIVRHCTQGAAGYLVGVEFIFEPEGDEET